MPNRGELYRPIGNEMDYQTRLIFCHYSLRLGTFCRSPIYSGSLLCRVRPLCDRILYVFVYLNIFWTIRDILIRI